MSIAQSSTAMLTLPLNWTGSWQSAGRLSKSANSTWFSRSSAKDTLCLFVHGTEARRRSGCGAVDTAGALRAGHGGPAAYLGRILLNPLRDRSPPTAQGFCQPVFLGRGGDVRSGLHLVNCRCVHDPGARRQPLLYAACPQQGPRTLRKSSQPTLTRNSFSTSCNRGIRAQ